MDELVADRATGPPTPQERFVPIEALFADFTIAGLNPEQHRLPLAAAFSNTHKIKSIAGRSAEKQAKVRRYVALSRETLVFTSDGSQSQSCEKQARRACFGTQEGDHLHPDHSSCYPRDLDNPRDDKCMLAISPISDERKASPINAVSNRISMLLDTGRERSTNLPKKLP